MHDLLVSLCYAFLPVFLPPLPAHSCPVPRHCLRSIETFARTFGDVRAWLSILTTLFFFVRLTRCIAGLPFSPPPGLPAHPTVYSSPPRDFVGAPPWALPSTESAGVIRLDPLLRTSKRFCAPHFLRRYGEGSCPSEFTAGRFLDSRFCLRVTRFFTRRSVHYFLIGGLPL